MKVLLLGGTGEARELALDLHAAGLDVEYSVAGITKPPALSCAVRSGGFGGAHGLARYLEQQRFDLLIDATHPYAARISANAAAAAAASGVTAWALRRPPWNAGAGDRWTEVADWAAAACRLAAYQRPLITLGRTPLNQPQSVPADARWLLRCVPGRADAAPPGVELLQAGGPFALDDELALLRSRRIDVLVCKNSGGGAVAAKLEACRELGLPVLMLARPPLPPLEKAFGSVGELMKVIG